MRGVNTFSNSDWVNAACLCLCICYKDTDRKEVKLKKNYRVHVIDSIIVQFTFVLHVHLTYFVV